MATLKNVNPRGICVSPAYQQDTYHYYLCLLDVSATAGVDPSKFKLEAIAQDDTVIKFKYEGGIGDQRLYATQSGKFHVRIGIHSGPVVAGIVGIKKYAYDIWGDTVNTAARMEQHSEAGKINISEATYTLVKEEFKCHLRGNIAVKNKGAVAMYFVESAALPIFMHGQNPDLQ